LHLSPTSLGSSKSVVTYAGYPTIDDDLAAMAHRDRAMLIVRACRAYLRLQDPLVPGPAPSERYSFTWYDNRTHRPYVSLGDAAGRLIAVYRVDRRWKLTRLRRFPAAITEMFDHQAGSYAPNLSEAAHPSERPKIDDKSECGPAG
jgi:hypothetical protein